MPAMKCFLKSSEEPIIVTLPARKIICFSIMSSLCHRGTPWRGCVHTAYTDFLLSCLVNYSSLSCPYHTDTRLLSTRLQSSSPWFLTEVSTISNWQKKKREKKLFLKEAQEHKKHTNRIRTRIDRFSVCNTGDVRCVVLYGTSTFHPHFADLNRHFACCSSCCHSNISIYPARQLYK